MERPDLKICKCRVTNCDCAGWNKAWEAWNKWDLSQWDWANKHYHKKLSHREKSGEY